MGRVVWQTWTSSIRARNLWLIAVSVPSISLSEQYGEKLFVNLVIWSDLHSNICINDVDCHI